MEWLGTVVAVLELCTARVGLAQLLGCGNILNRFREDSLSKTVNTENKSL